MGSQVNLRVPKTLYITRMVPAGTVACSLLNSTYNVPYIYILKRLFTGLILNKDYLIIAYCVEGLLANVLIDSDSSAQ